MKPTALPVWVRARAREYRLTYLLVILVFMMFVASPLVKMGVLRPGVVDVSFVLLLIVGIATLGGSRELTMVLAVVGGLALIAHLLVVGGARGTTAVLATTLSMLWIVLLAAVVLRPVLSYGQITQVLA